VARKPFRKKAAAKVKPELAQLKAIERLLEQEDYQAAVRRIKPLVQRFPNHAGLRRSLVEALQAAEGPGAAGLAAFDWAEQRRNNLPAQEALLYFAAELYLPALAGRAARRVRELGGNGSGRVPDPTDLQELSHDTLDTGSSVEDLERFNIGQLHLAGQDLHGALRWLDGMEQPPARNNRAVALFHLKRIDEALAVFMGAWQEHPENLFALSWAIQLTCLSCMAPWPCCTWPKGTTQPRSDFSRVWSRWSRPRTTNAASRRPESSSIGPCPRAYSGRSCDVWQPRRRNRINVVAEAGVAMVLRADPVDIFL